MPQAQPIHKPCQSQEATLPPTHPQPSADLPPSLHPKHTRRSCPDGFRRPTRLTWPPRVLPYIVFTLFHSGPPIGTAAFDEPDSGVSPHPAPIAKARTRPPCAAAERAEAVEVVAVEKGIRPLISEAGAMRPQRLPWTGCAHP